MMTLIKRIFAVQAKQKVCVCNYDNNYYGDQVCR